MPDFDTRKPLGSDEPNRSRMPSSANGLRGLLTTIKLRIALLAGMVRRLSMANRRRTLLIGGSVVLFVVAVPLGLIIYSFSEGASGSQKVTDAGPVGKKVTNGGPIETAKDERPVEKVKDENPTKNLGSGMAFTAAEDIWFMNADGSNPKRLTQDQVQTYEDAPTFSPDGKKIAYVQDIGRGVMVMDVSDRDRVELPVPDLPGGEDNSVRDPSWSPDGRRVAFMAYSQPSYMPGCDEHVFVTNADGSGTPRVFPTPGLPGCPLWTPAWSPDGSKIAITAPGKGSSGSTSIYVMDASPAGATGRPRLLTPDYLQGAKEPAWSPDGTEIAFAGLHVGYHAPGKGYSAIFKIDMSSLQETRLTKGFDTEHSPTWSPDGEKIAYMRDVTKPDYMTSVFIVDSDGSAPTLVRNLPASADAVDWRPQP
jgi:Tol biopolymer transport system component